jgi:hypothetical protein
MANVGRALKHFFMCIGRWALNVAASGSGRDSGGISVGPSGRDSGGISVARHGAPVRAAVDDLEVACRIQSRDVICGKSKSRDVICGD